MLTPEQIERRYDHLGGSDIARCMTGLYGGEASVAAEKIGRTSSFVGNNRTTLGDWAEGFLVAYVEHATRQIVGRGMRKSYKPWPILEANLDGFIVTGCEVVEAKLVMHQPTDDMDRWGAPGTDQVPRYVIVQTHVEMMCADARIAHVVAMIADHDDGPQMWRVDRNDDLCSAILDYAKALWVRIVAKEMPDVDESNAASVCKALARVQRETRIVHVPAGHICETAADWYQQAGDAERFTGGMRDLCKARLLALAGDADTLQLADGRTVTIKTIQNRGGTREVAPYEYQTVKVSEKGRKRNADKKEIGSTTRDHQLSAT